MVYYNVWHAFKSIWANMWQKGVFTANCSGPHISVQKHFLAVVSNKAIIFMLAAAGWGGCQIVD